MIFLAHSSSLPLHCGAVNCGAHNGPGGNDSYVRAQHDNTLSNLAIGIVHVPQIIFNWTVLYLYLGLRIFVKPVGMPSNRLVDGGPGRGLIILCSYFS